MFLLTTASRGVSYCPESNLPPLLEPGVGAEGAEGGESLEQHEEEQALHAACEWIMLTTRIQFIFYSI